MPSKKPRGMTYEDLAEIVLGMMYRRKFAHKAARAEMFPAPYDHAVVMLQKGVTDYDRIRLECGSDAVDAPLAAAEKYKSCRDVNWLAMLEKKYHEASLVRALREEAARVEKGNEPDAKRIHAALMQANGDHRRGARLDTIPDDQIPFTPTGLEWLDKEIGGLPPQGLIVVTASPKTGKTSLGIEFLKAFAMRKREGILYSLEMTEREVARRSREIRVPRKFQRHITIVQEMYNQDDIAYHIAREQWLRASQGEPPLELVVIDFADMLIEDEVSESQTAAIYRSLSKTAKIENLPIILFAQPNRSYAGGLVRPNHTRYSGMAEALGKLLITLYNPNTDFTGSLPSDLPTMPGRAYICVWACREGFRVHRQDNPGAIQVAWDGELAWGEKSLGWFKLSSVEARQPMMNGRR